ncbi:MAG: DUF2851 family protein [Chlorobi bacterium]|nr:DUF2851 family protein [Chlorobiota bacterium]
MREKITIPEKFIHYIWRNKLFNSENITDVDGTEIKILSTGTLNTDAGPDFFNAKIKIGDTIWAGNIEIHLRSSDWFKHNHHKDPAYNNVILHLVTENDKKCYSADNKLIVTSILNYDKHLFEQYQNLLTAKQEIPCRNFIPQVDTFYLSDWLSSLLIERAEQKTNYAKSLFDFKTGNWEEILYILTAKAFGFKVNALPFEMLAKSLPSIILAKHKNSKFQIEALLFGQAGMLENDTNNDDYYLKLKKEYTFLKNKYKLTPIEPYLWKFMRIRPSNFPTIRISQFADLIFKSTHLFSKILETKTIGELEKMFNVTADGYWNTHYKFGTETRFKEKKTGKSAVNSIIINTVIPILFLCGKEKANPDITEKAVTFLEKLKPEKNKITKKWISAGLEIKNAYFSQSLIQLYNEYCIKKRCLDCRIGHLYLQNNKTNV